MITVAEPAYADCLPGTWLAERVATSPAHVDAMRRDGELIAVRRPGSQEWLYPAWQFESWRPRPGVSRVVAAARQAGIDDARLYELLTAPLGMTGPRRGRLVDLLTEGREDEVIAVVRAA